MPFRSPRNKSHTRGPKVARSSRQVQARSTGATIYRFLEYLRRTATRKKRRTRADFNERFRVYTRPRVIRAPCIPCVCMHELGTLRGPGICFPPFTTPYLAPFFPLSLRAPPENKNCPLGCSLVLWGSSRHKGILTAL